ncbi:MAG: hypothetical protein HUJ72_09230, partial [Blautia sp.]|nr:hypothetical protein [Blautia sp.]
LPSADKLSRQMEELDKEKSSLQDEIKSHSRNIHTLSIIRSNFEVLLKEAGQDIVRNDHSGKDRESDTARTQDVL